ncbi:MAG: spondin domain-containing protein [Pseudomonadota bacterium]
MQKIKRAALLSAAAMSFGLVAGVTSAHATMVQVTVTNTQQSGGLSLTPVYFGFHNGNVDLFDVSEAASAGIEEIAETGGFGTLRDERLAQQTSSVGGVAFGGGGLIDGPLEPGETTSFTVDLDAIDNRYLFFASMILPSNDSFIGVDDPRAFDLFDSSGMFRGDQTFSITSAFAYDAGTEANDPANGAAFLQPPVNITDGGPGEGSIQQGVSLGDFTGLAVAGGLSLDPALIDYISDPNSFVFAEINVSEVPLPPAMLLMGAGLAGLGFARRRSAAA